MRNALKSTLPVLLFLSLMLMGVSGELKSGQSSAKSSSPVTPVDYVNTFVGTGGPNDGNTYPGAALPFGMIQWSPETTTGYYRSGGSYKYSDEGIRGFSLTHLDGPGCPVLGDLPILPVVGGIGASPATDLLQYMAKFSHGNEMASPGFYSVGLDNGAKVALTVTTRAGLGRFSFPATRNSNNIIFDVGHTSTDVMGAAIEIEGNTKVSGSVSSGALCHNAPNRYTVYFAAEFDNPFLSVGTWDGYSVNRNQRSATGPHTGGWVGFGPASRVVELRLAISYVSVANAWENLNHEMPGWDFDAVRAAAHDRWNQALGRITVTGGTKDQKRVFYTALYHSLLHPNVFNDVNHQYNGFDKKVHEANGFTLYANYSGWDIYRCQVQLLAMLFPQETSDMMQSLVVDAEQGGALPVWAADNDDACRMVGSPACPIIADAYAFDARNFDTKAALAAMLKGATQPGVKCNQCPEWDSLEYYLKYGYLGPDTPGRYRIGGPSQTLEFTTADFSIAQLAKALGDTATYETFMKRAQYWKNTFDTQTGYVEPRTKDGSFIQVDPAAGKYYIEGNAAQYSWMVPYNMRSLIDLMGGNTKVVPRLNTFFTELNAGGNRPYFFIGNEPVFAAPWAYDFAGAPWGAQSVTRRTELELFTPEADGLPGNDDLGATSSWYVFAALGVYPAIPAVGGVALNSPLFPSATIHLGNGKIIKIGGENASAANPYVQSLRVNGKPSEKTWISYDTLSQGVTLQFKLGSTPNKQWGTKPEDAPPSFAEGMEITAK